MSFNFSHARHVIYLEVYGQLYICIYMFLRIAPKIVRTHAYALKEEDLKFMHDLSCTHWIYKLLIYIEHTILTYVSGYLFATYVM